MFDQNEHVRATLQHRLVDLKLPIPGFLVRDQPPILNLEHPLRVPWAVAHAERFKSTRTAHQDESAQDYVEAILDLTEQKGQARLVELAAYLGVTHPVVSKVLKRLQTQGLVVVTPYKGISLTDLGMDLAQDCRERHRIVLAFLLRLGLSTEIAERDAEGIEHHVSPETIRLMDEFLRQ